ncbi:hypothetical protein ACP275_01G012000 [Erythranthe tilingii]
MKPSLLVSIITLSIFLTILVAKSSSAAPTRVTKELVDRVCPKTRNPDLCRNILIQYTGSPLFPQPLARFNALALAQATTTGRQIWDLYKHMSRYRSELKTRFHISWQKYSVATKYLKEVNSNLQGGINYVTSAKSHASLAMSAAQSGDWELSANQQHVPANIAAGSRRFQELCSILIVLCDELAN